MPQKINIELHSQKLGTLTHCAPVKLWLCLFVFCVCACVCVCALLTLISIAHVFRMLFSLS